MEKQQANVELNKPIPLEIPAVAGWKELPIRENGEPLDAIGPFSGNDYDRIFTSSIYFGERADSPYPRESLEGSLLTTFARREVAGQLVQADDMLPPGHHLMVMDSYRTLGVQQSLYDQYLEGLRMKHPDWTDEQLSAETQKFVSIPSTDPTRPSPHNTGGSVDVVIYRLPDEVETRVNEINKQIAQIGEDESKWEKVYALEMERIGLIAHNASMLDFGTKWDWGGPEAAVGHLENLASERQLSAEEQEAQNNRRLLYNVMTAVGFEPYSDEWWHYNSKKSQMGAKTAGLDHAEYGAAVLTEENLSHEQMRKYHLAGSEKLASARRIDEDDIMRVAARAAKKFGDFRKTNIPKAAKIEPPEEKAA